MQKTKNEKEISTCNRLLTDTEVSMSWWTKHLPATGRDGTKLPTRHEIQYYNEITKLPKLLVLYSRASAS